MSVLNIIEVTNPFQTDGNRKWYMCIEGLYYVNAHWWGLEVFVYILTAKPSVNQTVAHLLSNNSAKKN
jgi:hypothetical protein